MFGAYAIMQQHQVAISRLFFFWVLQVEFRLDLEVTNGRVRFGSGYFSLGHFQFGTLGVDTWVIWVRVIRFKTFWVQIIELLSKHNFKSFRVIWIWIILDSALDHFGFGLASSGCWVFLVKLSWVSFGFGWVGQVFRVQVSFNNSR